MSGYLLGVIGTVLLCSVLTVMIPEGKTSGVIKGVCKLVCVLAIVAPVVKFFVTGEIEEENLTGDENFSQTVIQTDEDFIKYYSELRIQATEKALESELLEKYVVACKVTLTWQFSEKEVGNYYHFKEIEIIRITVKTPSETEVGVKEEMSEYLTKNYCSEVLIE